MVFAIAWRRRCRVTRVRRISRSRSISGPRVRGCLSLPWRRSGCRRLAAIACQLTIVVADIADTMRHVEGRRLVAASVGSAADRGQSRALHSDVSAALLVGARRRSLAKCRKRQAGHQDTPEYTRYDPHPGLLSGSMPVTTVRTGWKVPALAPEPVPRNRDRRSALAAARPERGRPGLDESSGAT
jgi:hypothetical protein